MPTQCQGTSEVDEYFFVVIIEGRSRVYNVMYMYMYMTLDNV